MEPHRQERRARLLETRAQIQALKDELGVQSGCWAKEEPEQCEAERRAPTPPPTTSSKSLSASRRVAARPAAPSVASATPSSPSSPPPSPPELPTRGRLSVSPGRRCSVSPLLAIASGKCAPVAPVDDVPLQFPSHETVAHIVALKCELGVSPGKLVRPTPVSGSPRSAGSASATASLDSPRQSSGSSFSPAGSPVAEPHGGLSAWQTQPTRKEASVRESGGADACEPKRISFV
jgi:hypothetical protein